MVLVLGSWWAVVGWRRAEAYGESTRVSRRYRGTTDLSDWFELINVGLENEYLRLKKPLAGDYEIQAWTDSGQFPGSIFDDLPLATSASKGVILYDNSQFDTVDGVFMIRDNVLTPADHQHAWTDLTDVPESFTPAVHDLVSATHQVSDLTTGDFLRATAIDSYGFGALTSTDVLPLLSDWFEIVNSGEANEYLRLKKPLAADYEIQTWTDSGQFPGSIWETMLVASDTVLGGIKVGSGLSISDGVLSVTGGAGMVYPGAGIPLSTGSAWGTSITNNSANWNTAYSHTILTNNPHVVTASQVGLGNVTNESKAVMFTSPVFTGNVGIGTSSSAYTLEVVNTIGMKDGLTAGSPTPNSGILGNLYYSGIGNDYAYIGASIVAQTQTGGNQNRYYHTTDLIISTKPTGSNVSVERMRIQNNGNILIPYNANLWSRSSTTAGYNANITLFDGSGDMYITNRYGGSAGAGRIYFQTANTNNSPVTRMYITKQGDVYMSGSLNVTGEVTAYYSSDRYLKQNIRQFSALDKIDRMNPVVFNWNAKAKELNSNKDDRDNYGVIAQELELVMPELVHKIYDNYKSIDYGQLVPVLLQAIKEIRNEVKELRNGSINS